MLYTLRAVVRGCGPLRRRISETIEFISVRLDGPNLLPGSFPQYRKVTRYLPDSLLGFESPAEIGDDNEKLPLYSPGVKIEGQINTRAPLQLGDSVPLRLMLHVPDPISIKPGTVLKSIRVSLVSVLSTQKSRGKELVVTVTAIEHSRLDLPIYQPPSEATIDLHPTLWHRDLQLTEEAMGLASPSDKVKNTLQILFEFANDCCAYTQVSALGRGEGVQAY